MDIKQIELYATKKHEGQFRKNGTTPYITHPIAVAKLIADYDGGFVEQAAGLCHDIVEDCGISSKQLRSDLVSLLDDDEYDPEIYLIDDIVRIVDNLTDKYTKEAYPQFNREKRRKLAFAEFKKIADIKTKIVKFADIIHNLSHIEELSEDFAQIYLMEDFRIIRGIKIEHPIYTKAVETFIEAVKKMM